MVRPRAFALAAFAALPFLSSAAAAQSHLLDREPTSAVWAEFMYPSWDDVTGFSAYLFNLGARFQVGSQTVVFAEVPLATSSEDSPFPDDGFMVGNPYVGLRQHVSPSMLAELGFRPPLVGDDAPSSTALAGAFGDFDRAEAFLPESWMARGDMEWSLQGAEGARLALGAGASGFFPKGEDSELFLNYRLGAGIAASQFQAMAWFTGRWNVTSEDADFAESTAHQLTVAGSLTQGRARPTLYVRFPLDDNLDLLKLTLGMGVTIGF